jgi:hypothetical protein
MIFRWLATALLHLLHHLIRLFITKVLALAARLGGLISGDQWDEIKAGCI